MWKKFVVEDSGAEVVKADLEEAAVDREEVHLKANKSTRLGRRKTVSSTESFEDNKYSLQKLKLN